MMTIESPGGHPNLERAAQMLHVDQEALDPSFGVISVDPSHHLYAVLVNENAIGGSTRQDGVNGPFSNPGIGHFGPRHDT